MQIPYGRIARSCGMVEDFEAARRWLRKGLLDGLGDFTMLELRSAALRIHEQVPVKPPFERS